MTSYFETSTHGKWILTGEHAVLRGHSALVFPIAAKKLTLKFNNSGKELNASYAGECGADTHLLFWSVLEQGIQLLGKSINSLAGHFSIDSNLPIGVGMGASAALCVATARWFISQNMIAEENLYSFAKELENLFHGKSSGLDIVGVAANTGMHFQQGKSYPLELAWQPNLYLSSCGQVGITSHCIQQVQEIWQCNSEQAKAIDLQMASSVEMSQSALKSQSDDSLSKLADAMNLAADCFQKWGLVSESLQLHMKSLLDAGAIAVKPTGSGGGGYVVSLWGNKPQLLNMELISV